MPYAEQALPLQPTKKLVVVELARLPSCLGDLVPWWLNGYKVFYTKLILISAKM